MKDWKFQIKFSGLTAFVMGPTDSKRARVFLMNALTMPGKRHRPELRFDVRYVTTSPWKIPFPQHVINSDSPDLNIKRWMLEFVDLNFLPAPDVTLQPQFEFDEVLNPHLLKLTQIMPGASKINPDCFGPAPPQTLVAVRVPLRYGKMTTTMLAFEQDKQIVNCEFAPKGNPSSIVSTPQHCAIEMSLEFSVAEGPLTLIGVPFSNFSSSGIAFEPISESEKKIVVELENRPVDPEKSRSLGNGKEMDEDFSLHYELSLCKPNDDHRVVPIYEDIIRLESGNCIVGRFADDPMA
jgi:hypothetical protein